MLDDMALDPLRMWRREDFLGRNIGVAGDAVVGGRGAALPFMVVGEANGEIGAGPGIFQRAEALAVQPFGAAAQRGVMLFPGVDGTILVDTRGREDRIRQLGHRDILFVMGENLFRPGGAG